MADKNHRTLAFCIAAIIFTADQISKWAMTEILWLQQRGVIELFSVFDLRWVENRGISMGFLTAGSNVERWILVAITSAIAIGIIYWLWREKSRGDVIALSLVLGGALGNIVDRIRYGYVVDFADLHIGEWRPFLVFNVGDTAITIGILLLLARTLLTRNKKAH